MDRENRAESEGDDHGRYVPEVSFTELESQKREDGRPSVDLDLRFKNLPPHCAEALKVIAPRLPDLFESVREEDYSHRVRLLVKAFRPRHPIEELDLRLTEDTLYLRNAFFRRVKVLTAHQSARHCHLTEPDPERIVRQWRNDGFVFAVEFEGRDLYPKFQFGSEGQPLPIIRELISMFRSIDYSDWDIAFWFFGDSGWLDGESPISVLASQDPELLRLVRHAAEQTILPCW